MNPLPSRPLSNNPSAPLSLPNVPAFDQIAYNGRPRKALTEAGKEFPLLNGLHSSITSTPPPASGNIGAQLPPMERSHLTTGMGQQPSLPQLTSQTPQAQPSSSNSVSQPETDGDTDSEGRQVTAIFRPDEAGEWKEKLRLSHEAAEKSRLVREYQQHLAVDSAGSWDTRDEEEPKEEESEVEDDEPSLVGEGENTKVWKPKRTLRKLVST